MLTCRTTGSVIGHTMYEAVLRPEVSQGDIFANIPRVYVRHEGNKPIVDTPFGILLTHDCEYDKRTTETVLVAGVWPLADLDKSLQISVRKRQVFSAFYLPASPGQMPEAYVDLRQLSTVEKSIIEEAHQSMRRLLSLDDDSRLALQQQVVLFLMRPGVLVRQTTP